MSSTTSYCSAPTAFRPELYGESIVICRTVTAAGGGGYKLKSGDATGGKVIVDKRAKEELERILTSFRIQVDNPVAILNQDDSRTLLFKCDAHKLYELFMRATQLEECKRDYDAAAAEVDVAERHMRDKQKCIPDLKSQVREWEKRMQVIN